MFRSNYGYIIFLLLISLLITNCGKREDQSGMTDSEAELLPEQESWNSTITLSSSGKKNCLGAIRTYGSVWKYKLNNHGWEDRSGFL